MSSRPNRLQSILAVCAVAIIVQSIYLMVFDSPSMLYVFNVLVHIPLGIFLVLGFARIVRRVDLNRSLVTILSVLAFVGILAGLFVAVVGNTYATRHIVLVHAIVALLVTTVSLIAVAHKFDVLGESKSLAALAGILVITIIIVGLRQDPRDLIENEIYMPETMAGESMGGSEGPFFPSAASTANGELIPDRFFLESEGCGRSGCHEDAFEQWSRSAHHFASFNNQWYRKSIEYMQDVVGTQPAQWCAGCHDHALLFSGQMNQPVSDFLDTEASQAGLACVSCHSIVEVKNTAGNGGFVIEFPAMHDLATSDNQVVQSIHDLVVHLDPDPHRRTFLKPFHVEQPAEFCSSCHKVHLDEPVNSYRWVRGFNTYDNWQASGVSHEGARSFYAPPSPMTCVTCHMPQVESDDAGNKNGLLKTHDFIAANTALPVANGDDHQLDRTVTFLESGQLKVDIFAASEPYIADVLNDTQSNDPIGTLSSTFASGEELGMTLGAGSNTRFVVPITAPLENGMEVLVPARRIRLDVVVRTLGLGHFFPTGTVDAQEAWLEVKVTDAKGNVLAWSGYVDESGVVDPSAHFYRTLMVDANGNKIDKRNAWASRSVVYVNLIPPGAADVGHYVVDIPENVEAVYVEARLNYRKFDLPHTRFAYAGEMMPGTGDVSPHFDDRKTMFKPVANVSGKLQQVPEVPIVVMATDSVRLLSSESNQAKSATGVETIGRWNDYGIALLLEGDLKGAERAFAVVAQNSDNLVEGNINLARVYLAEGNLEDARTVLDIALEREPNNHKARYFNGLYLKSIGDYDTALEEFRFVNSLYPRDRVVLNELGRTQFLGEQLIEAVSSFESVLKIDPEDLMAHYNLMLTQRALGNTTQSARHEKLYLRYKADETSQSIAREYRQTHPHDNNEALPIHQHLSIYSGDE